jgi:hypothetical protein
LRKKNILIGQTTTKMGQTSSVTQDPPPQTQQRRRRRRRRRQRPIESEANPYYLMFGGSPLSNSAFLDPAILFLQHRHFQQRSSTPPEVRPTVSLKNDLNVLKRSLKLVPVQQQHSSDTTTTTTVSSSTYTDIGLLPSSRYTIQFEFDTNVACDILIHVVGLERKDPNYHFMKIKSGKYNTIPCFRFGEGIGQTFEMSSEYCIDFSEIPDEELKYDENIDTFRYPIVIEMRSMLDTIGLSELDQLELRSRLKYQFTYATIYQNSDGSYGIKAIRQKIQVDGIVYELAEIYGVDGMDSPIGDDLNANSGDDSLCVICMGEQADTSLIPCRHMCLCFECSKSLRIQTNKCPICRAKILSIIQIPRNSESGSESDEDDEEEPVPVTNAESSNQPDTFITVTSSEEEQQRHVKPNLVDNR